MGKVVEQKLIDGSWVPVVVTQKLAGGSVLVTPVGGRTNHIVERVEDLRRRRGFVERHFNRYTPLKVLRFAYWVPAALVVPILFFFVSVEDALQVIGGWSHSCVQSAVKDPAYDRHLEPVLPPRPPFIPLVLTRNRLEPFEPYLKKPDTLP
eukprot:TRINITY_DN7884_c1_g3_i1.p1 TRINITY_DN7884_c1_g3~~TRINITY_DN7884_c1_g3_i1.p1  ORF type:complete len:164 (+),score=45.07 TRINITY_DN7884_c1_g3_i1:42-494(+)